MDYSTLVARIKSKMDHLPGVEAQYKMAPTVRENRVVSRLALSHSYTRIKNKNIIWHTSNGQVDIQKTYIKDKSLSLGDNWTRQMPISRMQPYENSKKSWALEENK